MVHRDRALLTSLPTEVFQQILELVPAKRDRLRLGLVSRVITRAALESLWSCMMSLVPLLRLAPGLQQQNGRFTLIGNMRQWDWDRFDFYAEKIKKLAIFPDTERVTSGLSIIYGCITRGRPSIGPLLPNLRSLYHDNISSPVYSETLILDLAGPNLKEVVVNAKPSSDPRLISFLTVLSATAPNINRLVVSDKALGSLPLDVLSSFTYFEGLNCLKLITRSAVNVTSEILQSFGQKINLTEIDICLTNLPFQLEEGVHQLDYPWLKTLALTGDIRPLNGFLTCLQAPALESVRIQLEVPSQQQDPTPMTSSMVCSLYRKWAYTLLQVQLSVNWGVSAAFVMESVVPSSDISLHGLKSFKVDGNWGQVRPVPLGGERLETFLKGLPKLEELKLPPFNKMSLAELHIFARHCPQLLTLQVDISIDSSSLSESSPLPPLTRNRLDTLVVGQSKLPTSSFDFKCRLSRHLYRMFPRLASVTDGAQASSGSWLEVSKLLALCRATTEDDNERYRL